MVLEACMSVRCLHHCWHFRKTISGPCTLAFWSFVSESTKFWTQLQSFSLVRLCQHRSWTENHQYDYGENITLTMAFGLVCRNAHPISRSALRSPVARRIALAHTASAPSRLPWSQPPSFAKVPEEKIVHLKNQDIHQLTLSNLVKSAFLPLLRFPNWSEIFLVMDVHPYLQGRFLPLQTLLPVWYPFALLIVCMRSGTSHSLLRRTPIFLESTATTCTRYRHYFRSITMISRTYKRRYGSQML